MVMVPLSGSGLMRISRSPASPSKEGSVTLKNLSLSRASLALLEHEIEASQDADQMKNSSLHTKDSLPEHDRYKYNWYKKIKNTLLCLPTTLKQNIQTRAKSILQTSLCSTIADGRGRYSPHKLPKKNLFVAV